MIEGRSKLPEERVACYGAFCRVSEDGGEIWSEPRRTPVTSPHGPVRLKNGKIFYLGKQITEDEVSILKNGSISAYESDDDGRSWTDPEPMGFLGAPPHMLLHSSGAIILTYSRRKVGTQGVFARVSRDGGVTFGEETLIGPEAYIWDQGYPSTVELDGGSLLTVYYQRYEDDPFCSVLYSKWTLDEIK